MTTAYNIISRGDYMKKTMCVFGNDSRVLYISDFFNKNGYAVYKSADDYGKNN